jgi:hypothetical protein
MVHGSTRAGGTRSNQVKATAVSFEGQAEEKWKFLHWAEEKPTSSD